jgi:hypothetical protein
MTAKKTGGGSRHTTPREATLASRVLSGSIKPTVAQSKTLAASVLSQDAPKRPSPPKRGK